MRTSLWRPLEAGIYITRGRQLNGTESWCWLPSKFQEMPSASQDSQENEASQESQAEQETQVKEGEILLPVS